MTYSVHDFDAWADPREGWGGSDTQNYNCKTVELFISNGKIKNEICSNVQGKRGIQGKREIVALK